MTVGEHIKAAREKAKMTQTELGNKIGVSGVAIMRYEKGQRQPRLEQLQRIADILEIPLYSLITVKNTDADFKLVQDYLGLTESAMLTLTNGIRTFPGTGYPYSDTRTLVDVLNSVLSDSTTFLTMLTYIRIATAPMSVTLWTWGDKPPTIGPVQFDPAEYIELACKCLQEIIKSIAQHTNCPNIPTKPLSPIETVDQPPPSPEE